MKDICKLSFTITGYLKDGKERCQETGHDIEGIGQGVVDAFQLDAVRVVIEVEE